ncbi:putative signal transducing protein [Halopseudomonas sabulinigri]|uniref:Putative signal transducing protein n=1 Tax=Halopseudomonas sabulinigri TaxID=472181 RepID=A0A1H1Q9W7_9GAMM|nr:DUF2007 domain-containing protein [Halopseudomonas sabulinigri]SDS20103.1 Putative signal transducing protein [Halopseudomonas sabulinigri]
MQCIYRPLDLTEATLLQRMLADHHIDCHISGQYLQGAVGDLPAHDLIALWLSDEDAPRGSQLINDYLAASPLEAAGEQPDPDSRPS